MGLHGAAFAILLKNVQESLLRDAIIKCSKGWVLTQLLQESGANYRSLPRLYAGVACQHPGNFLDGVGVIESYELHPQVLRLVAAPFTQRIFEVLHRFADHAGAAANVRLESANLSH